MKTAKHISDLFKILLASILIFTSMETNVLAQKEANIWYFGNNAGLDFNFTPPKTLTNSKMNTLEGCASIANKQGELLFYTDGKVVWNKAHQIMKNGTGLEGHNSSTQSAVIVPKPNTINSYYIFTVDGETGSKSGAFYSEVDMDKDSGHGEITVKNQILIKGPYKFESIGATKHGNNKDYWVCYVDTNATILSFKVSGTGVDQIPVKGKLAKVNNPRTSHYMKFSSNNKLMAVSMIGEGLMLSKFDDFTGIFSSTIVLSLQNKVYSCEFSSNSKLLYTNQGEQYDVSVFDSARIAKSMFQFRPRSTGWGDALQLGPDQKIYLGMYNLPFLSVIDQPNVEGQQCGYREKVISLDGKYCKYGLPTFLQTYLSAYLSAENMCFGDSTKFSLSMEDVVDSIKWDLGYGNPDSIAWYNQIKVSYIYPKPGTYLVQVHTFKNGIKSTYSKEIKIINFKINLGPDLSQCEGDIVTLDAKLKGVRCTWQDGSTNTNFVATQNGIYHVTADSLSCFARDTIQLVFKPLPSIDLGPDTLLCNRQKLHFDLNVHVPRTALWSNGTTELTFDISEPGAFWVRVEENGCFNSDTITATFMNCTGSLEMPNVFTPNDDQFNNLFIPIHIENFTYAHIYIYNRWGVQLTDFDFLQNAWNGMAQGRKVPSGTYFWVVDTKDMAGVEVRHSGTVALIR